MRKHIFTFIGLLTLSTGFALGLTNTTASAKAVKVPTSLRGTWYHYDPSYGYSKVKMTKYHFHLTDDGGGSIKMSGVKYPKYAQGHAEMSIYRSKKGYYTIGKYASDQWPSWKRVNHKGHAALRCLTFMGPGYSTDYWYKTKAIAKHPTVKYKIAKFNGFYYTKYTPAYLQLDEGPQKLYKSADAAKNKTGHYVTVKSIYKKYSARWDSEDNDILRIRVNDTIYYYKDNGGFQSFNTWRDKKFIESPYSPTSKSKIVLRHGDSVSKATRWSKEIPTKDGIESLDIWSFSNGKWTKM